LIAEHLGGNPMACAPATDAQLQMMLSHVQRLHDFYGAESGLRIARKHVGWTIDTLWNNDESKARKAAFNAIANPDQQIEWLMQLAEQSTVVGLAA
jgi:tRNA-dihydrouridine synthase B